MKKKLMKESMLMIKSVDMDFINGVMGIFTGVTFLMIYDMDMVKCFGKMDLIIKESGN